ncbi:MAG TPA: GGDEF domain-containing response regulator [Alphaproteobacteria bacterium]
MAAKPLSILIVDDSADDRDYFARLLEKGSPGYWAIQTAASANDCFTFLDQQKFDCVLLDYNLPAKDGLRVLNEIRLRWPDLPVIMLTGEGNENIAVQALKSGAQDYMPKGSITADSLSSLIKAAMDRKQQEMAFLYQANHDDLTGLANRRMFVDRLQHAFLRSQRTGSSLALLYLDLDGFKGVNDTHGHAAGDALLQQVAQRIVDSLREYDTPARLGGDEFAVLLEDLPGDGVDRSALVAQRTIQSITGVSYAIEGHDVEIGVSLGIALYPLMAKTPEGLFKLADKAMYAAKHDNKRHRERNQQRRRKMAS